MSDIIQNIGLIVASLTAIFGINAWLREFRGKKQYELAEEVLTLFYDCRDRLRAIRSPFSRGDEGASRDPHPSESPDETTMLNRAYTVFERYEKYQEAFAKLFAIRYRFMASFGREAAQPIEDFRMALNKVFISAQMLPTYWKRQGRVQMKEEEFERYLKEMREHESVFWGTFSDKDEFNTEIENIASKLEATCSCILRPVPVWHKVLHCFERNREANQDMQRTPWGRR